MDVWRGDEVWAAVAAELREYRQRGLAGLMTEDTVRFATARALIDAGVAPSGLRAEWPHPALRGSRVDLAVGGEPPSALIEFKFPREPTEQNAAWTMALGEVLKDFYRLAACPGDADRLFVYIETGRLRRYMAGAANRFGFDLDVEQVALRPADAARLPTTAARIIGAELATHHVVAQRIQLVTIDDSLRLALYLVDPIGKPHGEAAHLAVEETPFPPDPPQSGSPDLADNRRSRNHPPAIQDRLSAPTRNGARREILEAIRSVLARSNSSTFTVAGITEEMHRVGTGYAESTIRTMISAHMCANAPDNAGTTFDDLERTERGVYRLAHAGE